MARISLNGHPTWARLPKGKGEIVVLLHGGLSSSASLLRDLEPGLEKYFVVTAFDRRGHGRTGDTDEPFSYSAMADETIAFIEFLGKRVHLVGHSDGGNVALELAMRRPDLLRRVVLIGANFHHAGLVELTDFTPQSNGFAEFAVDFGARSPDGAEHAAAIVEKSLHLVKTEPTHSVEELRTVSVPVLVIAGDDDVAKLSHTVALYEALPEAQLAVVPGASHALIKEHTRECVRLIRTFLLGPIPPVTLYPLRRSPAGNA